MRRWRPGCWSILALLIALVIFAAVWMLRPQPLGTRATIEAVAATPVPEAALRPASAFADIADPQARSVALFQEAGRVIQHPRCLNCHPRTDRPTQTAAMRPHMPAVTRGPDGGGASELRCTTCHRPANFDVANIPGNPKWALAPAEQAWQGRSLGEICRQLLDPSRSHMTQAQLLEHMRADELVGWAWHPGGTREPAPGTQAQFGALIEAWLASGATCPA
ncbi:Isoquinoline 1-oxidoreductase subunit [Sphingomonas sp.]|uniref:Isoquinoline 1-oxidoreductase subunit n=1 Tax=Sphingomonas sp. TaxID=28214 RepID=UPI002CD169AA|nr:Isoquinoline 1-oxidoreductase subunit [Sphingomonas sp.]HTG37655.1 Isoquinoline 1-oxidoreductase subunit [Sphingomonas sp.]